MVNSIIKPTKNSQQTHFMYECFSRYFMVKAVYSLLAHLGQRLIGELIVYPWSGVHPSFKMLKHLRNNWTNQRQILCGASLGRGNEKLFAASGHMTKMTAMPIYGKNPSKIFSATSGPISTKLGM